MVVDSFPTNQPASQPSKQSENDGGEKKEEKKTHKIKLIHGKYLGKMEIYE